MKKYDNIPGFPGYYISKRGLLWSRYSNGVLSNVWIKKKFYLSSTNGRYKTSIVHETLGKIKMNRYRLVALAYIPNPKGNPEVCHKDNNPTNDYYKNLYWGTHKENMHQMIRDGRWYTPFNTEDNPNKNKRGWKLNTSITESQFRSVIKMRELGLTNKVIIDRLKIKMSSSGISRIWKNYLKGYYDSVLNYKDI